MRTATIMLVATIAISSGCSDPPAKTNLKGKAVAKGDTFSVDETSDFRGIFRVTDKQVGQEPIVIPTQLTMNAKQGSDWEVLELQDAKATKLREHVKVDTSSTSITAAGTTNSEKETSSLTGRDIDWEFRGGEWRASVAPTSWHKGINWIPVPLGKGKFEIIKVPGPKPLPPPGLREQAELAERQPWMSDAILFPDEPVPVGHTWTVGPAAIRECLRIPDNVLLSGSARLKFKEIVRLEGEDCALVSFDIDATSYEADSGTQVDLKFTQKGLLFRSLASGVTRKSDSDASFTLKVWGPDANVEAQGTYTGSIVTKPNSRGFWNRMLQYYWLAAIAIILGGALNERLKQRAKSSHGR